jgi:sigma-B regulation protein RsbU (phosphoserine phosphatase)
VDRVFYRQRADYRKTIQAVSEAMTSILDPKQIQRMLVGTVVSEMFLENGLLALESPADSSYRVEFTEGMDQAPQGMAGIPAEAPLVKYLKGSGGPIFRYEVERNPVYEPDREVLCNTFLAFSSEAMIPLRYKDRLRGVVSLGRKKSGKFFTLEDVALLKTIASQGAIALENARLFEENLAKGRMEEELKIARDIQTGMLPDSCPEIEGYAIAAASNPAREVGGDFYDFIPFDGEGRGRRLAIVVGDVSGKAISGALVMAASRSVFRALTEMHGSVEDVMNRANFRLKKDVKKGMFVAALFAVLDPEERILCMSNAGQTQPVLCPGDGSAPVYLDTEGDRFPLGIVEDCRYEASRVPLKGGDVVVLYTDGVVEAVNGAGEMYGFERFLAAIAERRSLPAEALLSQLVEDVERFVGGVEKHDDVTIVVVKKV